MVFTHLMFLPFIAVNFYFTDGFAFGINNLLLTFFILSGIISYIVLKHPFYILSVILQQLSLLFIFSITSFYFTGLIALTFALMHPTTPVRVGTFFLAILSFILYMQFDTVLLGMILHLLLGTALFYARKGKNPEV